MGNNLDFRISQPALVQALETYRTMETLLAQEKEKQLENADCMGVGWDGAAAQTTRRMMAHLVEEGVYGQAAR